MSKLNNKGFAIAGMLYTLLIIFLALIFSFLLMLNNRKTILDQIKKDVYNDLSGIIGEETGPTIEFATSDKTYKAIVYLDPTDLKKTCTESNSVSTTETKTGCMKWYVYAEDGDTYTMILDHNTTIKADWTEDKKEINDALDNDTKNWDNRLNPRLITADEIAHIVGADRDDTIKWNSSKGNGSDDIETKVSWFYFDGSGTSYSATDGWQKPLDVSKEKSKYAWLFNYTDCLEFGCEIEDKNVAAYWTSTTPNRDLANNWVVNRHGYIAFGIPGNFSHSGIRPVITVDKSVFDNIYYLYEEEILNGAVPKLYDNLIPVLISNNGEVKKADIYDNWYSYEDKKWANAVILTEEDIYNDGDIIPDDKIESYFVWIPKYSYKIFDMGNYNGSISEKPSTSIAHEIDIKFGIENTNDSNSTECTTPLLSGDSGNCNKDKYMTHPAFISLNVNGIWVGKFETTGSTDSITIRPNLTSLRNVNVSTMFKSSYNYKRDNDSHMMKNTEWGAVTYLSHSKYGINKEININNNSSFITGYSATDEADQSVYPGNVVGTSSNVTLPYNTVIGYKASTTGNISGIYDMSGGTVEYVAAYIEGNLGSSGFTNEEISTFNSKYFDVYNASCNKVSYTSYNYRILGDATGEMGPFYYYKDNDIYSRYHNNWYSDNSYFINSTGSWFRRGGGSANGVIGGQFFYHYDTGAVGSYATFRIVLD